MGVVPCSAGLILCALLSSAALGQAQNRMLFVTNNQGEPSKSVSAMRIHDDGSLGLVGTYAGGPQPVDCALLAGGQFLLVLCAPMNAPATLNALLVNADGSLSPGIGAIEVGAGARALTVSSTNIALVASSGAASLQAFRVTSGGFAPTGSASAGAFPTRPITTPDGRFAYCVGPNGADDLVELSLSSTGALARLASTDLPGAGAFGAALHPTTGTLYVSTGQSNTLRWYGVNQITGAATSGGSAGVGGSSVVELAVDPTGTWLYSAHVLSDTLRVTRINADGSLSPTQLSYAIRADIRDIITDGRFVWVTDETPLGGGQVGVLTYRVESDGALTQVGAAASTGSFRPQFMALWSPRPFCLGDANRDNQVTFADITSVLVNLGGLGPIGDANGDGTVAFDDVAVVLSNMGMCGLSAR